MTSLHSRSDTIDGQGTPIFSAQRPSTRVLSHRFFLLTNQDNQQNLPVCCIPIPARFSIHTTPDTLLIRIQEHISIKAATKMPHAPSPPIVYSFPSADVLSEALASFIIKAQKEAIEKKGKFTVAISGGTLPKTLTALASKPGVKWDKWCVLHPSCIHSYRSSQNRGLTVLLTLTYTMSSGHMRMQASLLRR